MFKKIITVITLGVLSIGIVFPAVVNAASTDSSNSLSPSEIQSSIKFQSSIQKSKEKFLTTQEKQVEIDKVAKQLEFLFTEAVSRDENGQITSIDFSKLEDKYPVETSESEGYQSLKIFMQNQETKQMARGAFLDCMVASIKDYIGGALWTALITGGIYALIEEMAWQELAAIIVEVAGSEFTVIALVGALSWMAVNCA